MADINKDKIMQETLTLLRKWHLSELCEKFQEEEVSIFSFRYLTLEDIQQLIPKIGPRSIFIARLKEWLHTPNNISSNENAENIENSQNTEVAENENYENDKNHTILETTIEHNTDDEKEYETDDEVETPIGESYEMYTKAESSFEKITNGMKEYQTEVNYNTDKVNGNNLLQIFNGNATLFEDDIQKEWQTSSSSTLSLSSTSTHVRDIADETKKKYMSSSAECRENHKHFITPIAQLIRNSTDGRRALAYYELNDKLDTLNRKNIVSLIISMITNKRIRLFPSCFHNITEQLVELMPNENQNYYYTLRRGKMYGLLHTQYRSIIRKSRKKSVLNFLKRPNRR